MDVQASGRMRDQHQIHIIHIKYLRAVLAWFTNEMNVWYEKQITEKN